MSHFFRALTLLSIVSVHTHAAQPDYGPQPTLETQTELLEMRETAWRTWFGNDVARFKKVVPDELVAIGWGGGEFSDRDKTLQEMQEFAASGSKLGTLHFPENVFQQYGDVVILYTRFELTLVTKTGEASAISGRGTEIFVKRQRRWIHTGWHLDNIATNPEKPQKSH